MLKHVAPRRDGCTNEELITVITRSMKHIDFVARPHIYTVCNSHLFSYDYQLVKRIIFRKNIFYKFHQYTNDKELVSEAYVSNLFFYKLPFNFIQNQVL